MRVLITGVTGFVGGHLAEHLRDYGGYELIGGSRAAEWPVKLAHLARAVELLPFAWEPEAIEAALDAARPEAIVHLAGYAHAGRSFAEPSLAWAGNLAATQWLYAALARVCPAVRIVYASTGQVYGTPLPGVERIDELHPLQPMNPYAASKAAADLLTYQMAQHPKLNAVRARPFNHIGARQSPDYATAHFAKQIAAIALGRAPAILETGDLSSARDLVDVRDVVEAYRLMLHAGTPGSAYNIGSGEAVTMQSVVDRLCEFAGVRVELKTKADRLRPADSPIIRADASKLRSELGWEPRWALGDSLSDLLGYWRGR